MLDISAQKKHSLYYKLVNIFLSLKRRTYAYDKDDVKSNVYYEFNLEQYFNLEYYLNIFKSTTALNKIETPADIQQDILGLSPRKVTRNNGSPAFIFKEKDITIFIYKWRFNELKNRCKIHFYKNKAFLVTHNYQLLTSPDKVFIYNAVAQKYSGQASTTDGLLNCKIIDRTNNIIFFQEVLQGLTVSYLSNVESAWFEGITMDIKEEKRQQVTESEMISKKFYSIV